MLKEIFFFFFNFRFMQLNLTLSTEYLQGSWVSFYFYFRKKNFGYAMWHIGS